VSPLVESQLVRPTRALGAALVGLALALLASAPAAAQAPAITPLGQFGEGPGDQAGLLDSSLGVAVDSRGRVYASELTRISVFSPQGPFLRAFGKNVAPGNARTRFEQCTTVCQAGERGGDSGELNDAAGLAVDAEDILYVADARNHRVSVFDQQGGFVRSFGKDVDPDDDSNGTDVCDSFESCEPGVPGTGPGELNFPQAVAIDPAGVLLVADVGNNRVSLYSRDGSFLRAFGRGVNRILGGRTDVCSSRCGPGVRSDIAGALAGPVAVAVDRAGNVYVSEFLNRRVSVFSPDLAFQRAFGSDVIPANGETGFEVCTSATGCKAGSTGAVFGRPGSGVRTNGPGVLNRPVGVALDTGGRLYVAESENHRVSVFSPASAFLGAFGKDVVPDNSRTGFERCGASCKAGASGAGPGELNGPSRVALDCRGALYVAEAFNGRIARFGEPGTPPPPCAAPPATSRRFGIMDVRRNPRKATATLIVSVPWSAGIRVRGRGIRSVRKQKEFAGRTRLAIRPTRATMRRLARSGKAVVRARVTYAPWGGDRRTKTRKIELRKPRSARPRSD
jgi:DNA-binding beta-propeller fold protein YncE